LYDESAPPTCGDSYLNGPGMQNSITELLSTLLRDALGKAGLPVPDDVLWEVPREESHGDYATNVALALARPARKAPREIAEAIRKNFPVSPMVSTLEVAGPGFLNVSLAADWCAGALQEILAAGERYGTTVSAPRRRVLLEFVSANPTGPLVIVNARAAAVGDALARILRSQGMAVECQFYVNDAGNQFEALARSVDVRLRQVLGETAELPENAYPGEYLVDLVKEWLATDAAAMRALATRPEAERVELLGRKAVDSMVAGQRQVLESYGTRFESWTHEQGHVRDAGLPERAIAALTAAGHTYEQDGALWFRSTAFGDDKDRVLRKSDGELTYFGVDVGFHHFVKFGRSDLVVDLIGPDHHGYVSRITAAMRALGHPPESFDVLVVQLVTLLRDGEPVRMSKRRGEFVLMEELLEEVGRALHLPHAPPRQPARLRSRRGHPAVGGQSGLLRPVRPRARLQPLPHRGRAEGRDPFLGSGRLPAAPPRRRAAAHQAAPAVPEPRRRSRAGPRAPPRRVLPDGARRPLSPVLQGPPRDHGRAGADPGAPRPRGRGGTGSAQRSRPARRLRAGEHVTSMRPTARGRSRGGPGRAQWIVLLTASALILVLTFALGVLVGRQWSRPVAMTASAEAGARKTIPPGKRGGLSSADVEPVPSVDQKLTFYQTLTAPLGRSSADASQRNADKTRPATPRAEPVASPPPSRSTGHGETLIEKPVPPEAKAGVDAAQATAEASGPWSVQAGAFKTRAQADGLERQLRQAGFDAYVTQASGEDGQTRFRVRVGTFKNKPEAQRMADRMRAERSVAAFVAPK
jgi:arginyl-tRNA synthetase